MDPPDDEVLEAFGGSGPARRLPGGAGQAFVAGGLVLKPAEDAAELAWIQELAARIESPHFRVPRPRRADDGTFVHRGWVASELIADLRPAIPNWDLIRTIGRHFGDAATTAAAELTAPLPRRTHRWAVADRVAWGEETVELATVATDLVDALLTAIGPPPDQAAGIIHGDLTGNVHLAPTGSAVVLDLTPYRRPPRWAEAIVVCDAVTWLGADPALATTFASDPDGRDLLARAMVLRIVSEQLADAPRHHADLSPFDRLAVQLLRT